MFHNVFKRGTRESATSPPSPNIVGWFKKKIFRERLCMLIHCPESTKNRFELRPL